MTPSKQFEQFLDRQKDFQSRRKENIDLIGKVYDEQQQCTFEPQINETSSLLVQMQQHLSELGMDNCQRKARQTTFSENSFVPKINHTSRLLAQNRNSKIELTK